MGTVGGALMDKRPVVQQHRPITLPLTGLWLTATAPQLHLIRLRPWRSRGRSLLGWIEHTHTRLPRVECAWKIVTKALPACLLQPCMGLTAHHVSRGPKEHGNKHKRIMSRGGQIPTKCCSVRLMAAVRSPYITLHCIAFS